MAVALRVENVSKQYRIYGRPGDRLTESLTRGRLKRHALERFDGEPIVGSPVEELLIELGFRQGPRKLTLSA